MKPFNESQAKENFEQSAKNITGDDVKDAASTGQEKIDKLSDNIPKALLNYWQDIKEMVGLLKDYFTGEYTEAPWKVITAIAASVLYFVSPMDLVPDLIPVLGFLDDAFVIGMCLSLCRSDMDDYRKFKNEQSVETETADSENKSN